MRPQLAPSAAAAAAAHVPPSSRPRHKRQCARELNFTFRFCPARGFQGRLSLGPSTARSGSSGATSLLCSAMSDSAHTVQKMPWRPLQRRAPIWLNIQIVRGALRVLRECYPPWTKNTLAQRWRPTPPAPPLAAACIRMHGSNGARAWAERRLRFARWLAAARPTRSVGRSAGGCPSL